MKLKNAQQQEMRDIREEQKEMTATLSQITSSLGAQQRGIQAQQQQMTMQQQQLGDVRRLQQIQLRMMRSILATLNAKADDDLVALQSEINEVIVNTESNATQEEHHWGQNTIMNQAQNNTGVAQRGPVSVTQNNGENDGDRTKGGETHRHESQQRQDDNEGIPPP